MASICVLGVAGAEKGGGGWSGGGLEVSQEGLKVHRGARLALQGLFVLAPRANSAQFLPR